MHPTRYVRLFLSCMLPVIALAIIRASHILPRVHSTPAHAAAAIGDRETDASQSLTARGLAPSPSPDTQQPATPRPNEVTSYQQDPGSLAPAPTSAPPTPAPTAAPTLPPATPTPPILSGRPTLPFTHTVQAGDTLWDLATLYDINVDSIVWANERLEENRDAIQIGQALVIPPVVGALHTVVPGDTVSTIAAFYKVQMEAIIGYAANMLQPPYALRVGHVLVIPGGTKPLLTRWVSTDKGEMVVNAPASQVQFGWPASGLITQYFSRNHLAIDIANREGSPVLAAADGVVISVGEKAGGFGIAVMIDHGEGYGTLYSHLRSFSVGVGDRVARGQTIGEMGVTGIATGPHLDFRIYYQGGAVNPFSYLP